MPQAAKYIEQLHRIDPIRINGKVTQVIGLTIESEGPEAGIGDVCHHLYGKEREAGQSGSRRLSRQPGILMPLGELETIGPGSEVVATGRPSPSKSATSCSAKCWTASANPRRQLAAGKDGRIFDNECAGQSAESPPGDGTAQRRDSLHRRAAHHRSGQRIGIFAGSGWARVRCSAWWRATLPPMSTSSP